MARMKPSLAEWHPWRLRFRRPRGSQLRLSVPRETGFPQFCYSKPLAAPAHPHLPACRVSSCTRGARTGLDPIPPGPDEHIHSTNCSARPVWGEACTKALWVGAAFPVDDLQLLPASSPSRWIILLCRVHNYRLCHLPGLGRGSRWEDVYFASPTSWVLGAAGRAKGMQWGKQ